MRLRLRIGQRMALGSGLMIFLVLIVSISGFLYTQSSQRALSIHQQGAEQRNRLTEIRVNWLNIVATLDNMLITRQTGLITQQLERQLNSFDEKVNLLQTQNLGATPEIMTQNQQIAANLDALSVDLLDLTHEMTAVMEDDRWARAQILRHTELVSQVKRFESNLNQLDENIQSDLDTAQADATQVQNTLQVLWAITSLIALLAGAAISYLTTSSLTRPMEKLASTALAVSEGDLSQRIEITRQDEVGDVALAFNQMTQQLQSTLENLENTVAERTAELEYRARQLQTAAEVGQAATTIRDLDALLSQVTQLISKSFNFYHAGIFLLNSTREYAVLTAANSEGGQRMLARQHKLKVGETGIVGYVTAQKKPRIALDVGQDAVYFDNPDMPETRSEMALPLMVGGELLGALDVQSKRPAAFSDEDVAILQVLADQIAIAIDNARLFTKSQDSLASAQRAYSMLTQEGWSNLLESQPELGFLATPDQSTRLTDATWSAEMVTASQRGENVILDDRTVAIPIKLRQQVLGVVRLQKNPDAPPWSTEEINLMDTLIDQLEYALENARLHHDVQQRARREHLVTEITTKIRSTTDPNQMLETALGELRAALKAKRAQIVMQDKQP